MTIDKLKRVMQRLRFEIRKNEMERPEPGPGDMPRNPNRQWCRQSEMRRAIFIVCGTTRMTYYNNYMALVRLGWVQRHKRSFRLTGKDITEDF